MARASHNGWTGALLGLVGLAAVGAAPAAAQTGQSTGGQNAGGQSREQSIDLELNKLESIEAGCRAYVVLRNPTAVEYGRFNLELLVFGTDGVIEKRLAVPVAPLRAGKTTVNLFDITDVACEGIGEMLLNGFFECTVDGQPVDDCLERVTLSSRAEARFYK